MLPKRIASEIIHSLNKWNAKQDIRQKLKASKGNPGAINALAELSQCGFHSTLDKIIDYGISGTDVYVLWSDLCGRNSAKVDDLVTNCPKDILIDACSRQDRSGLKLVKQYF